jgi:hypothetical protein
MDMIRSNRDSCALVLDFFGGATKAMFYDFAPLYP